MVVLEPMVSVMLVVVSLVRLNLSRPVVILGDMGAVPQLFTATGRGGGGGNWVAKCRLCFLGAIGLLLAIGGETTSMPLAVGGEGEAA